MPAQVIWNFTTVSNAPQYNATGSVDFELHRSDEIELVLKILTLAGVETKSMDIVQIASGADQTGVQQEKQ